MHRVSMGLRLQIREHEAYLVFNEPISCQAPVISRSSQIITAVRLRQSAVGFKFRNGILKESSWRQHKRVLRFVQERDLVAFYPTTTAVTVKSQEAITSLSLAFH